uniref:JmjC domain-containing protein n=1 Tax=Panagrolaimus superbus TaxID=310955 RepID=A0A914Y9U2_9BILA
MYDVDFYTTNKIPYYFAIQEPGEMVITNPNGFHGVANTGKNYSEAVNFYCMGTVPESLKFPLCDCSHITAEYQKEDWQSYINYCRGVETKMRNVSIGLTTKTSILEVNHKKGTKKPALILQASTSVNTTKPSDDDTYSNNESPDNETTTESFDYFRY